MLIVAVAFVILMLMGMPLAFAIGISGSLFFVQHPELPFTIPVQVTVSQTQNFALLAIPLFILAGNFMNRAGITERLLDLASALTGHLRGGLAQISLALSALMGSVSGSAIADAAMQSRLLGDGMIRRGFTRGFAAGVISFGSVLTPLVPPGIGMILYGTIGQVSIGRLFAAGLTVAVAMWLALALTASLTARRRAYPTERPARASLGEMGHAARLGVWALLFPVFLIVGLRAGLFTPSEIGAVAVLYAVFVGVLIHRKMKLKGFVEGLESSLSDIGAVMFLIALSAIFSYGIVLDRVPEVIANLLLGATENVTLVMILIALVVVLAGFFVDATVLIIMLTPIVLPVVQELGGDSVHFGMVFIVAATIGNFTPPVGAAMYAVCSILRCPMGEYWSESVPLFLAVTGVAVLIALAPGLVLFLPNLIFGG